jgi:hypothetical protein
MESEIRNGACVIDGFRVLLSSTGVQLCFMVLVNAEVFLSLKREYISR